MPTETLRVRQAARMNEVSSEKGGQPFSTQDSRRRTGTINPGRLQKAEVGSVPEETSFCSAKGKRIYE